MLKVINNQSFYKVIRKYIGTINLFNNEFIISD